MLSYNNNTENKLLKQLEYYFSDVNLGRDKFMRDRLREGLGYVSMETIMRFNNVKRFTRRYVDVRDAINASKLLVLNDESRCITRVDFIGNDYLTMINNLESECKGRSIVALGFDLSYKLRHIEDYLGKHINNVDNIMLRRGISDHKFRGSVYITFRSLETAVLYMNDPAMDKCRDNAITKEWELDYEAKRPPNYEKKIENKFKDIHINNN